MALLKPTALFAGEFAWVRCFPSPGRAKQHHKFTF